MGYKVEIGISNKHLHLSSSDVEKLFGKGHELTPIKDLKQPGQFASEEKVDIVGPKGTLKGIRVLGPTRPETQIELSMTDARTIGVNPPIRESGDLDGSPGIKLIGPEGEVDVTHGVIIALRHIHLSSQQAEDAGLKDKDWVCVKIDGPRSAVLEKVLVRAGDKYEREFHLDTDEGNACGAKSGDMAEIVGPDCNAN